MNGQVKRIVCPVDFSEPSELALAKAVTMAQQSGAELRLITVVQPMTSTLMGDGTLFTELRPMPAMLTEEAEAYLAKLRDKHCAAVSGRTTLHVAFGVPFVEIVRYARESEADLIVMGSHGRTGIEHLLIGSVAERVVRKAPCSVMVVRDAKRRFAMP